MDGVGLMPITGLIPNTGSLFNDTYRSSDLGELLRRPGARLVMPSEESEDFIDGLRYVREFDGARLTPNSDPNLAHNVFLQSYARVFVNAVAEPYMKHEKLRFPAGSMIVREKLGKPHDTHPTWSP